jgi:hypothetical protein
VRLDARHCSLPCITCARVTPIVCMRVWLFWEYDDLSSKLRTISNERRYWCSYVPSHEERRLRYCTRLIFTWEIVSVSL